MSAIFQKKGKKGQKCIKKIENILKKGSLMCVTVSYGIARICPALGGLG